MVNTIFLFTISLCAEPRSETILQYLVTTPIRFIGSQPLSTQDDKAPFYRRLSEIAYDSPENRPSPLTFNFTNYIRVHNRKRIVAYRDPDTNNLYIAFRGTWEREDLLYDFLISVRLTRIAAYFREAMWTFNHLAHAFPDDDVFVTGHSLGGTVAVSTALHDANQHMRIKGGMVFNAGSAPRELVPLLSMAALYVAIQPLFWAWVSTISMAVPGVWPSVWIWLLVFYMYKIPLELLIGIEICLILKTIFLKTTAEKHVDTSILHYQISGDPLSAFSASGQRRTLRNDGTGLFPHPLHCFGGGDEKSIIRQGLERFVAPFCELGEDLGNAIWSCFKLHE